MTRSQLRTASKRASNKRPRQPRAALKPADYPGGVWGWELAERLRHLMQGVGVRAWAEQVGLSGSLVSSYLNGTRQPGTPVLRRIAEKTSVSLDWLLFGEGGEGPVLRGQWRTKATLEDDVAAHVERESGLAVGFDRGEWKSDAAPSIAADVVLRSAVATVKEEARQWRVWSIRMRDHLDSVYDRVAMAGMAGRPEAGAAPAVWADIVAKEESIKAHQRFFLPDGADAPPTTTVYRKGGVFLLDGAVIACDNLHQGVAREAIFESIEHVAWKRRTSLETNRAMHYRDRYNAIRAGVQKA